MLDLVNVHPKSHRLKYSFSGWDGVGKGTCANHFAWWFVLDPKYQMSAALIGDGDAIAEKLVAVVLIFRFFEFKGLCLGGRGTPNIHLLLGNGHARSLRHRWLIIGAAGVYEPGVNPPTCATVSRRYL